ncbi:hypothetical protein PR202_ga18223 [Eleusine coracana subsp. coracana]|uniref:Uncharacterized protein n=1 Tax=Eleusine coracana subsp. coracana TaxID=191504 RepID=A0AAV5CS59_ELECO|nr:hypothetical protein PR202_ga18223 [Eleusine coracana subsp. coracana]
MGPASAQEQRGVVTSLSHENADLHKLHTENAAARRYPEEIAYLEMKRLQLKVEFHMLQKEMQIGSIAQHRFPIHSREACIHPNLRVSDVSFFTANRSVADDNIVIHKQLGKACRVNCKDNGEPIYLKNPQNTLKANLRCIGGQPIYLMKMANKNASYGGGGSARWCNGKEKNALLDLKASLKGFQGLLSSWNNFSRKYGLTGDISPSLVQLIHLEYLDLHGNDFGGAVIPEFIGTLENLRHLDLSSAGFGGKIPSELGNLSKLSYLDISFPNYSFGSINYVDNLRWLSQLSSLFTLT